MIVLLAVAPTVVDAGPLHPSAGAASPVSAKSFQRTWVAGDEKWEAIGPQAEGTSGDQGLRVCSSGAPTCGAAGEFDELAPEYKQEAILLSLETGWAWTDLWVSSLDTNNTGAPDRGRIYWGDTADIPTLLLGGATKSFSFKFGDLADGAPEGDLLKVDAFKSIFDKGARHVLFVPDSRPPNAPGTVGDGIDYRVFGAGSGSGGGGSTIPEPATILLVSVGLAGAGLTHRRRARLRSSDRS